MESLAVQMAHRIVKSVCPIFIGSDGYIDTSAHEPDARFDTALRILEVGNFHGIAAHYY